MARPFILTAQINLQAPNATKTIANIRKQLKGINAKVNVNVPKGAANQLNNVNRAVQDIDKSAKQAGQSMGKFTGGIRGALTYLVKYDLARSIINGVVDTIRDGVQAAVSFEKELIKVGQVTGKSLQSLQGLQNEIGRLSKTLGVSSSSLVKTSRVLAQTGINAKEVEIALGALAKSTLAATFDDIAATTETAIAAMRQFGFSAGQLESELGRINALAANFAVEAGDIGVAIRRAGGAFKAAGGQLIELEALFTSVRATTRETAETIATGFRTIFTRIQRPKTIQFLRQVGVELQDLAGNFVGPFEAVRRLNIALKDLDPRDVRYSQIVEQLGGFRQVSKVIPLIQQFATAQNALSVAQQGGSSLAKDAAKAQLGLGNQITKVKEEFQELFRTLTASSGFQNMIKLALSLATAMVKVVEAVAPLVPLLAALAVGKGVGFLAGGLGRGGGGGKNQGGRIHKFASGGVVPGTGNRDTVPAMLTPGEFVIKKRSVKSIGNERLHKMNKYATGGIAKFPSAFAKDNSVDFKLIPQKNKTTQFKEGKHAFTAGPQKKDTVTADIIPKKIDLLKILKSKGIITGAKGQEKISNKKGTSIRKGKTSTIKQNIGKFVNNTSIPKGNAFEDILYDIDYIDRTKDGNATFDGTSALDGKQGGKLADVGLSPRSKSKMLDKRLRHEFAKNKLNTKPLDSDANELRLSEFKEITNATSEIELKRIFDDATGKKPGAKLAVTKQGGSITNIAAPKRIRRGGTGATGGIAHGTDTVPAMLTPGEFVINRNSASRIGYGNLNRANQFGEMPKGFAAGGRVPSSGKRHFGIQDSGGDKGGGGGGAGLFKLLLILDVALPALANKFKVAEGKVSEASAVISAFSSTVLIMTTAILLFGDQLKKVIPGGGKGQLITGAIVGLGVLLGQYFQELGRQLAASALANLNAGGFKSESETARAKDQFVRGKTKEALSKDVVNYAAIGAGIGGVIGTIINPGVGTAIGAGVGGSIGAGIGVGTGLSQEAKFVREFAGILRTLKLGASLEQVAAGLKEFQAGQISAQRVSGLVTSKLEEIMTGFATIETDQQLVDFSGSIDKIIPQISQYINKVAASAKTFDELSTIVGKDTLNAFSQLSGVSLERIRKEIESGIAVRKKSSAAQKAQLKAIEATNKVLRQARSAVSGFAAIEQGLTEFDAVLSNTSQSISNSFGPAVISKIGPQFDDISNIFNFDNFNQQVDNVGTIMGSAGAALGNDVKQFAQVSSLLPNVLTEAASEIGIGGARAADIIEEKLNAADPGGIIGAEFRNAIIKRIQATAGSGDGGEGKFAERIREDIQGVVRDLTKGMKETQEAFKKAADFIDKANARLSKAYSLRTKLELTIAKQLSNIIALQYENEANIRRVRGEEPDQLGEQMAFAGQQEAFLSGTSIQGLGGNVKIVGEEFVRLKQKISESNAKLSRFGTEAVSGVKDLTESQRSLIDENAKLKEEFAKTKQVLLNYANIQKRVGFLQEKIAKEQTKRGQMLAGASALAFATDQRRSEMAQEMFATQVAARRGISAVPDDMRAAVLGVLNQFSEVALFNGKTGKEVKREIDISFLEKFFGPLTDAQKKQITEATTAEERFIGELKSVQDQAVEAQKALLTGMGEDRKDLAKTIGNLHRELVTGIKDIFLTQQQRDVEKQLNEAKSTRDLSQRQLGALQKLQQLGIPVEDARVLDAVRNNIGTIKALNEAIKARGNAAKIEGQTGLIREQNFQDVGFGGGADEVRARNANLQQIRDMGDQFRNIFGVDLGNKLTAELQQRLSRLFTTKRQAGEDVTGADIASELRIAMGEFGATQTIQQDSIIASTKDTLQRAGIGQFVTTLTNNMEAVSAALAMIPPDTSFAGLTAAVDAATGSINTFQTDLKNIKANIEANTAAGANIEGNAAGGPVTRFAGGGFSPHGTDTVPAMLTPGEFVVNKAATQRNAGALHAINSGKTQYLAKGGEVGDWFGRAGKFDRSNDLRFLHEQPEKDAVKALVDYVKNVRKIKQDKDGNYKSEYDLDLWRKDDLPFTGTESWGGSAKINKPGYKLEPAKTLRWKPSGQIVGTIPAVNDNIVSGDPPPADIKYATDIAAMVDRYKTYVDKNHNVQHSATGKDTSPGWVDSGGMNAWWPNHYKLVREASRRINDPPAPEKAQEIWDNAVNFAKDSKGPIDVTGGFDKLLSRGTAKQQWDVRIPRSNVLGIEGLGDGPSKNYFLNGQKWDNEKATKWFRGQGGRSTIGEESRQNLGSYVKYTGTKLFEETIGTGKTFKETTAEKLAALGNAWKNQTGSVSATYADQSEKLLEDKTEDIQKFLRDGTPDNYQKRFLGKIFNKLDPEGSWARYSSKRGAYQTAFDPKANFKDISAKFSGQVPGQFSNFGIDPTNYKTWLGEKDAKGNLIPGSGLTGGNTPKTLSKLQKKRASALKDLKAFFADRQGPPVEMISSGFPGFLEDETFSLVEDPAKKHAAGLIDEFQQLIGLKVPDVGMDYYNSQVAAKEKLVREKELQDESLLESVKVGTAAGGDINSPLLKKEDLIAGLIKSSSRLGRSKPNRVPNYAKRADASLRGVRDLRDVKWDGESADAVLPFLTKLGADLNILVNSGMISGLDSGKVDYSGGRVLQQLTKSFDLIRAGKPDSATTLDIADLEANQVVPGQFSDGTSLLSKMKIWSGSFKDWYGKISGEESLAMDALFGKGRVFSDLGVMEKSSKGAVENALKTYNTLQLGKNPDAVPLRLAAGGPAFAPYGTDTVPAMLTPGEFVVNKKSAKANMPLLKSINSGTQYLQEGGTAKKQGMWDTIKGGVKQAFSNSPAGMLFDLTSDPQVRTAMAAASEPDQNTKNFMEMMKLTGNVAAGGTGQFIEDSPVIKGGLSVMDSISEVGIQLGGQKISSMYETGNRMLGDNLTADFFQMKGNKRLEAAGANMMNISNFGKSRSEGLHGFNEKGEDPHYAWTVKHMGQQYADWERWSDMAAGISGEFLLGAGAGKFTSKISKMAPKTKNISSSIQDQQKMMARLERENALSQPYEGWQIDEKNLRAVDPAPDVAASKIGPDGKRLGGTGMDQMNGKTVTARSELKQKYGPGNMQNMTVTVFKGKGVKPEVQLMIQDAINASNSGPDLMRRIKQIETSTGQKFAYRSGSTKSSIKPLHESGAGIEDISGGYNSAGIFQRSSNPPEGVMNSWWNRNQPFGTESMTERGRSGLYSGSQRMNILPITDEQSKVLSVAWQRNRIANEIGLEVPGGAGRLGGRQIPSPTASSPGRMTTTGGTQHFGLPELGEGGMDTVFRLPGDEANLVTNPLRISRPGDDLHNTIGGLEEQLFIRPELVGEVFDKLRLPSVENTLKLAPRVGGQTLLKAAGGLVPIQHLFGGGPLERPWNESGNANTIPVDILEILSNSIQASGIPDQASGMVGRAGNIASSIGGGISTVATDMAGGENDLQRLINTKLLSSIPVSVSEKVLSNVTDSDILSLSAQQMASLILDQRGAGLLEAPDKSRYIETYVNQGLHNLSNLVNTGVKVPAKPTLKRMTYATEGEIKRLSLEQMKTVYGLTADGRPARDYLGEAEHDYLVSRMIYQREREKEKERADEYAALDPYTIEDAGPRGKIEKRAGSAKAAQKGVKQYTIDYEKDSGAAQSFLKRHGSSPHEMVNTDAGRYFSARAKYASFADNIKPDRLIGNLGLGVPRDKETGSSLSKDQWRAIHGDGSAEKFFPEVAEYGEYRQVKHREVNDRNIMSGGNSPTANLKRLASFWLDFAEYTPVRGSYSGDKNQLGSVNYFDGIENASKSRKYLKGYRIYEDAEGTPQGDKIWNSAEAGLGQAGFEGGFLEYERLLSSISMLSSDMRKAFFRNENESRDKGEKLGFKKSEGFPKYAETFATGGPIFAPKGTDTVPAMLTPGEFVMKKSAVDKHGVGFMQSINNGTQYLAEGGLAGNLKQGWFDAAKSKPGTTSDEGAKNIWNWPPMNLQPTGYTQENSRGQTYITREPSGEGSRKITSPISMEPGKSTSSGGWVSTYGAGDIREDAIGSKGLGSYQLNYNAKEDAEKFETFKTGVIAPGSLASLAKETNINEFGGIPPEAADLAIFGNDGSYQGGDVFPEDVSRQILSHVDPFRYLGAFKPSEFSSRVKNKYRIKFAGYSDNSNEAFKAKGVHDFRLFDGASDLKVNDLTDLIKGGKKVTAESEEIRKTALSKDTFELFNAHRQSHGIDINTMLGRSTTEDFMASNPDEMKPLEYEDNVTASQLIFGVKAKDERGQIDIMQKKTFQKMMELKDKGTEKPFEETLSPEQLRMLDRGRQQAVKDYENTKAEAFIKKEGLQSFLGARDWSDTGEFGVPADFGSPGKESGSQRISSFADGREFSARQLIHATFRAMKTAAQFYKPMNDAESRYHTDEEKNALQDLIYTGATGEEPVLDYVPKVANFEEIANNIKWDPRDTNLDGVIQQHEDLPVDLRNPNVRKIIDWNAGLDWRNQTVQEMRDKIYEAKKSDANKDLAALEKLENSRIFAQYKETANIPDSHVTGGKIASGTSAGQAESNYAPYKAKQRKSFLGNGPESFVDVFGMVMMDLIGLVADPVSQAGADFASGAFAEGIKDEGFFRMGIFKPGEMGLGPKATRDKKQGEDWVDWAFGGQLQEEEARLESYGIEDAKMKAIHQMRGAFKKNSDIVSAFQDGFNDGPIANRLEGTMATVGHGIEAFVGTLGAAEEAFLGTSGLSPDAGGLDGFMASMSEAGEGLWTAVTGNEYNDQWQEKFMAKGHSKDEALDRRDALFIASFFVPSAKKISAKWTPDMLKPGKYGTKGVLKNKPTPKQVANNMANMDNVTGGKSPVVKGMPVINTNIKPVPAPPFVPKPFVPKKMPIGYGALEKAKNYGADQARFLKERFAGQKRQTPQQRAAELKARKETATRQRKSAEENLRQENATNKQKHDASEANRRAAHDAEVKKSIEDAKIANDKIKADKKTQAVNADALQQSQLQGATKPLNTAPIELPKVDTGNVAGRTTTTKNPILLKGKPDPRWSSSKPPKVGDPVIKPSVDAGSARTQQINTNQQVRATSQQAAAAEAAKQQAVRHQQIQRTTQPGNVEWVKNADGVHVQKPLVITPESMVADLKAQTAIKAKATAKTKAAADLAAKQAHQRVVSGTASATEVEAANLQRAQSALQTPQTVLDAQRSSGRVVRQTGSPGPDGNLTIQTKAAPVASSTAMGQPVTVTPTGQLKPNTPQIQPKVTAVPEVKPITATDVKAKAAQIAQEADSTAQAVKRQFDPATGNSQVVAELETPSKTSQNTTKKANKAAAKEEAKVIAEEKAAVDKATAERNVKAGLTPEGHKPSKPVGEVVGEVKTAVVAKYNQLAHNIRLKKYQKQITKFYDDADIADTQPREGFHILDREAAVDSPANMKVHDLNSKFKKTIEIEFNKTGGQADMFTGANGYGNFGLQNITLEQIQAFASGGSVFSPKGTDTVPAMLTPGEFVVRKSAVDAVGVNALKNINSMSSGSMARSGSYFHKGGPVGKAGAGAELGNSGDLLRGILTSNKNTTQAVEKLISAFQQREEARGQGASTSYTLNSDNFTKAVGAFDKSIDRLADILSVGIVMMHEHAPMAINMTVEGNVDAVTDSPALANLMTNTVNQGINQWAISNGMTDMIPAG